MGLSWIDGLLSRADQALARGEAFDVDLTAEELVSQDAGPASILERTRATTTGTLDTLRARAARLEAEAARMAEDLRQTRRVIAALESAARIMGAGA